MLINLTNHPSTSWSEKQKISAIDLYESIHDMPFPQINPEADELEIKKMAIEYLNKITLLTPKAVHIMGEMNFTFQLVKQLLEKGIICIASTTLRKVIEIDDKKITTFEFVMFRNY